MDPMDFEKGADMNQNNLTLLVCPVSHLNLAMQMSTRLNFFPKIGFWKCPLRSLLGNK